MKTATLTKTATITKTSIMVATVLLLVAGGAVYVVAPLTKTKVICADSDGGIKIGLKGTTALKQNRITTKKATDSCLNLDTVTEYSCRTVKNTPQIIQTDIKCAKNDTCWQGACTRLVCTDEDLDMCGWDEEKGDYYPDDDSGYTCSQARKDSIYTKSKADISKDGVVIASYPDKCAGNVLAELTCRGYRQMEVTTTCQYGCRDGACLREPKPSSCFDSDGGNNTSVFGTAIITDAEGDVVKSVSDKCLDPTIIEEIICREDDTISYRPHNCANEKGICSNGVCLPI